MRRTTIRLPEDLHERLRQDALRAKTSMAEIIRTKLLAPAHSRNRNSSKDPILKVAGVYNGPILSDDIDDALYSR